MAAVGQWSAEHPLRAAAVVICVIIGSTVTVKRLELPVYRWARDWIFTSRANFATARAAG